MDNCLEDWLTDFLTEELSLDEDEVVLTARLVEDLNADELDLAEIYHNLESEFEIHFSDSETDKVRTVGELTALLYQHGAQLMVATPA